MNKAQGDKICVVCGDRSLGFNFNVISCESCKAFFRRNAISKKAFTCPFSNSCDITVITRRFCQKCRLDKCFKVGMKKEYIMTDEDKKIKKKKIEQNRIKRKLKVQSSEAIMKKIKEECSPTSTTTELSDEISLDRFKITSDSSVEEIISAIMEIPEEANEIIQRVMKTQGETLSLMCRIIQEPQQALLLISHLIKYPSDGMLIISKMMSQSPLDALSVFTQFLSSPTHALHIIFKVMSSPGEVLKFMTELTKQPQNALDIMSRFMPDSLETSQNKAADAENETIKSVLDASPIDSPNSAASPRDVSSPSDSYHESDSNNNNNSRDYQQMTATILKEIAIDLTGKQNAMKGNSIDQIINEAIKLEYTTPQFAHMHNGSRELNEVEQMKIQELLDANDALQAPIEENHLSFLGLGDDSLIKSENGQFMDPILLKVINLTAVAIRRLIKMSKRISGFKKMCQEDQIALLKGGCTEMMILRSVMQYDSDKSYWKIPSMNKTKLKVDILKLCPKGNVFEEHENFIKTFDVKLRTDERIILIMCAITLFSPERASIVHREVIKMEQNSYYFLLRRYLESVYEGCEARSIFLQLLRKIHEVRRLNEDVISVYLDVNPGEVEPLLREIFDLKV